MRKYGPRRRLNVILIRAADPPTEFVPLDYEQARERADAAVTRMKKDGMAFATAAKIYSDDPTSKVRGGDVGMHGRDSAKIPSEVLEAAFAIDPFTVSDPIRTEAGWFLVMPTEVEDDPSPAVLRNRMREDLANELVREMLERAQISLVDA